MTVDFTRDGAESEVEQTGADGVGTGGLTTPAGLHRRTATRARTVRLQEGA